MPQMFEGTEAMLSHADGVLVNGRDIDIEPNSNTVKVVPQLAAVTMPLKYLMREKNERAWKERQYSAF